MSKFKKALSLALSATMIMTSLVVAPVTASAAPVLPVTPEGLPQVPADIILHYEEQNASHGEEERPFRNGTIYYEYDDGDESYRNYDYDDDYDDDDNFKAGVAIFMNPSGHDVDELEGNYLIVPYDNKNYNMDLYTWNRAEEEYVLADKTLDEFNRLTGNNYTYVENNNRYEQYFELSTNADGELVKTPISGTAGPAAPGTYRVEMYLRNNTNDDQVMVTMYRDFSISLGYYHKVSEDGSTLTVKNVESEDGKFKEGDVTAEISIEAKDMYASEVIESHKKAAEVYKEVLQSYDDENFKEVAELKRPETIYGLEEFNAKTGLNIDYLVVYVPATKDGKLTSDQLRRYIEEGEYSFWVPEEAGSYFAVATPDRSGMDGIIHGLDTTNFIYATFDILLEDNENPLPEFETTDGTLEDGVISGVDKTMEYSINGAKYKPVTGKNTTIKNVPVGVPVQIRYQATDTLKASEPVTVTVQPKSFTEGDTIGVKAGVWIVRDDNEASYDDSKVTASLTVNKIEYNDKTGQYFVRVTPKIEDKFGTIAITSEKFDVNPSVIVSGGTGTEKDPYTFKVLGEYYDYDVVAEGDELTVTKLLNDEEVEMEGNPAVAKITAEGGTYDPAESPKKPYEAVVTGIEDINALNPDLKASHSDPVYYDEDGNELETPPTMPGTYKAVATVTVDGEDYEIETEFTIEKAENEKIDATYLGVTGPATRWFKTGTITGVKEGMEYSTNGGKTWKPVTGKQINGLGVGEVLIRFAETDEKKAGQAVVAKVNLRYKQSTVVPVVVPVPVPTPTPTPVPTPTPTPTPQPTNPWGFWGWLFNPWKR